MMRNFKILICCLLALAAISSCAKRVQEPPSEESQPQSSRPLDPLATATDREVVPEVYPIYLVAVPDPGDSLVSPRKAGYEEFDSTQSLISPTEVYRVQIFTSRLFNEAETEKKLANEIFNLPVYLDYEVPYYKLRVGDFLTRNEAEAMVSEIKNIGYRSAWVARVILRIREAPEIINDELPILPEVEKDTVFITPADSAQGVPEDNR